MTKKRLRVAAIQLEVKIGDVPANLAMCEQLLNQAGEAGAQWIILPEFFTSGMGFTPELKGAALPLDGPATQLLQSTAKRFGAQVGGSFLCRDSDGHVRNTFILVDASGILGRHDKDEPTLWEN